MRRRDTASVLTLVALLTLGALLPAAADPGYPGADDVRRAQRRTAAAQDDVRGIQARLDQATARVEAADVALSAAAEDFDQARVELDRSRQASAAAAEVSRRASERLQAARRQVGRLAAQSYRSGGAVAALDVILSPSGPDQVLERASMMRTLAVRRQKDVHRMDAARVVATDLRTRADQALARQEAAAQKLARARAAAQTRAAQAHDVLTAENRTRTELVRRLAAARRTSVTLERARQAGLAQEAAERREAKRQEAERREAQRRRQAARAGRASASSSGGSSSAGGSSSSSGSSSSGSSSGSDAGGSSGGSSSAGASALAWARQKTGLPYRWGGDGPGSYDCSGLTMRAWQQAGVLLPHSSRLQYRQVQKISYSRLRPGDLVFFATDPGNPETIHHVAMYAGGGQMIEAPYTGANVRVVTLRQSDRMPYAGRP